MVVWGLNKILETTYIGYSKVAQTQNVEFNSQTIFSFFSFECTTIFHPYSNQRQKVQYGRYSVVSTHFMLKTSFGKATFNSNYTQFCINHISLEMFFMFTNLMLKNLLEKVNSQQLSFQHRYPGSKKDTRAQFRHRLELSQKHWQCSLKYNFIISMSLQSVPVASATGE